MECIKIKNWINGKGFCFLQKTELFTYFLFNGVEYKVFDDVLNYYMSWDKPFELFLDECEKIHV